MRVSLLGDINSPHIYRWVVALAPHLDKIGIISLSDQVTNEFNYRELGAETYTLSMKVTRSASLSKLVY